jgi:hypothetical protein
VEEAKVEVRVRVRPFAAVKPFEWAEAKKPFAWTEAKPSA